MPKLDEYLRTKQAAEHLGVARNTLRNWESAGKIPVHRHPANNCRFFKVSDLDKLLTDAAPSAVREERDGCPKRPR